MKKTLRFTAALALTIGSAQAQTFTNASFETWHNFTATSSSLQLETPNGWHGTDSLIAAMAPLAVIAGIQINPVKQLFKTTTAHSGTFAAEVRSGFIGTAGGNAPGVFTNAKIGVDLLGLISSGALNDPSMIINYLSYTEGTAISAKVDKVKAWVKLDNTNLDNASVSVLAVKTVPGSSGDSTAVLGAGTFSITPGTNEFTEITIPLEYTSTETPEKLIVAFVSSDIAADSVHEGNTLYVDDVSFTYDATSIQQPLLSEHKVLVYPNPAKDLVYFNLNAAERAADYTLTVTDVTGRVVLQERLKQQVNAKTVSAWVKGNYCYSLLNTKTNKSEQGKFTVQ